MKKKVVVLGGGTGMSNLLNGLKEYPVDISAIVSVSDSGSSTGKLREEFNTPAVGDVRKVMISLAETEPLVEKLFDYRFKTNSDLNGHAVGNLLLTALVNITGNMSDGITALSKVLNLKGKVIPLTEESVTLVAKMTDNSVVEGEEKITFAGKKIKKIYYKEKPKASTDAITAIKDADLIVLSMGSLYTSIIPNLLIKDIVDEIDNSKAKIVYVCNMMTQPGETDKFNVSDHIRILNKYLGKRKIDYVIANNGNIDDYILKNYLVLEQKDPVKIDKENINIEVIEDNLVAICDNKLRHDNLKLAFHLFSLLLRM